MGDIDCRAGTPLVRRAAGTVLTALAAGVLITGCAPAPGGGGSNPAPDDGGGSAADSGPDQSGSSSGGGSSAEKVVVKTDMGNKPGDVKPDTFALGTTGGDEVEGIKWSSWNGNTAVGKGTLELDRCEPSCAGGGVDSYRNATVKLTGVQQKDGEKQYTKYTMTAPGLPPETARMLTNQQIED